jgi:glycosyltransferase involved in cell wall biosynthesis
MILALVPYQIFPVTNGGRKAIAYLLNALSNERDILVGTVPENTKETSQVSLGLNWLQFVHPFSSSFLRYFHPYGYFALKKIAQKEKISWVWVEHPYMGWMAILLKKSLGVQMLVRAHNVEWHRWRSLGKWWWPMLRMYENWVFKKADVVCFISEEDRALAETSISGPHNFKVLPYGVTAQEVPSESSRAAARQFILKSLSLEEQPPTWILHFNGALHYQPNAEAVRYLCEDLVPLLKSSGSSFLLVITGGGLPTALQKKYESIDPKRIKFTGFVEEIDPYFSGADLFLNPILSGGGVKTKLIEALSMGSRAVTTQSGGNGVPLSLASLSGVLIKTSDELKEFSRTVLEIVSKQSQEQWIQRTVGPEFFEYFQWLKIANRASSILHDLESPEDNSHL